MGAEPATGVCGAYVIRQGCRTCHISQEHIACHQRCKIYPTSQGLGCCFTQGFALVSDLYSL